MSLKSFTPLAFRKHPANALLLSLGLLLSSATYLSGNTNSSSDDGHTKGWVLLENDYTEIPSTNEASPASVSDTCYYTLQLFDSFGDGWNGSVLTITVNGVSTGYTFTNGTSATFVVAAISNAPFIATYTAGAFQNEVTYNILDPGGNIIFSDGPFPQTGEVLNIFACPTCPGIQNVNIDDVGALDADISWTAADSAGVYHIEYGLAGFTYGTGNMLTTSNTAIHLTGLQEKTVYDFYISIACDNGDSSAVVGPVSFQTIWLIDVGVSGIHSPETECMLSNSESVEVMLKNYGDLPQSLIPFRYSVNGVDAGVNYPADGFYTGVISNDSTKTVSFQTTYDFSQFGEYTIEAWTELPNDSDILNDSFSYMVTNIPFVTQYPYFTDYETWKGGWLVNLESSTNSTWAFGQPNANLISSAASGVNAWVTNLNGNYNNSELSYLVSPCYDFSSLNDDPVINFSLYYHTETSWDGAWLEGSTDGGNTWSKIGAMGTGLNWYNFNNTTQGLGNVWAGNSLGWIEAENFLTGFAGEPDCRFRFVFDSDPSVNSFEGIGIDDVLISPVFQHDLSMLSVENTSLSECGDEEDHVTVEIRNAGLSWQNGFDVSYQVDGGFVITENAGALVLPPGAIGQFTFTTPFNSNSFSTNFEIVAWTSLSNELNFINDTASYVFTTVTPDPLPLVEDFENIAYPPGWVSTGFITNAHNNVSYVSAANLYAFNTNFQMTTSNIGPINPGDSLTFDYRYVNWSAGTVATVLGAGDFLNVQISTDCGDSFTTVYTIDQNNHTTSNVMANQLVDLDQFAGEVIKIRFLAQWGTGDYWLDIDNINIIGCPQSLNTDIQTNYESSAGANDGSIIISATQGQPPYDYQWSDPNAPDNIGQGTYIVTITDANGCAEVHTIELGVCPDSLGINPQVIHVSQPGGSNGKITIAPTLGEGPYTYEWSTGSTNATISNLPVGEYEVTVTDAHNCSEVITITVDLASGLEDLAILSAISLAPNPTSGISTLSVSLTQAYDVQIQLVNVVGQVLLSEKIQNSSSFAYPVDLSDFPGGIYFVRVQVEDQLFIEKLVRAR